VTWAIALRSDDVARELTRAYRQARRTRRLALARRAAWLARWFGGGRGRVLPLRGPDRSLN